LAQHRHEVEDNLPRAKDSNSGQHLGQTRKIGRSRVDKYKSAE
jgi:hypothetical protein